MQLGGNHTKQPIIKVVGHFRQEQAGRVLPSAKLVFGNLKSTICPGCFTEIVPLDPCLHTIPAHLPCLERQIAVKIPSIAGFLLSRTPLKSWQEETPQNPEPRPAMVLEAAEHAQQFLRQESFPCLLQENAYQPLRIYHPSLNLAHDSSICPV